MIQLIEFILSTAGLTWIIVKSLICRPAREFVTRITKKYIIVKPLDEILNCIGCFGFWSGLFNYIFLYKRIDLYIIPFGFIGSISSLILISVFYFLNKK